MSSANPPTGTLQVPVTNCNRRARFSLSIDRTNCNIQCHICNSSWTIHKFKHSTNPFLTNFLSCIFYQRALELFQTPNSLVHHNKVKLYMALQKSGTTVAQWLRCCATNRKVAGSIPDGVNGIFHWHNPSDCTVALGSTQPLTEMSTSRISWG